MEQCKGNKRKEFFYLKADMFINAEIRYHIGIFEKGKFEVHPFSQYFTDKIGNFSLKNKSFNTIKNFHLTFIIRFLNFIFNDSKTPIDNIENLKLEMIEEFLDRFSQGKLPNDNLDRWRSKDTVNRATYAISHFVYWLLWKKVPNTSKKMFKMKYIKNEDFDFDIINIRHKNNEYTTKQVEVLTDIVTPVITTKTYTREKRIDLTSYGVNKLIEISQKIDPMMTFAIVLGAYSGLRVGELSQIFEGRIKGLEEGKDFGAYLDLKNETILRSDNKITGSIKGENERPIYPGCTKAIYGYYQMHIDYLKSKNLYPNKYGALLIDNNGRAMTTKTISRRFNKIEKIYEEIVLKEASYGCKEAIIENQLLKKGVVTVHSLRYYFKQLIETMENGNQRKIQYYMGHKSLESQDSYGVANATLENIRKCQNEIYMPVTKSFK